MSTRETQETAHTPGPWRADDYGNVFADDDQMHVAEMRGWGRLTGTGGGLGLPAHEAEAIQGANARLIAASPLAPPAARALLRCYYEGRAPTMAEVILATKYLDAAGFEPSDDGTAIARATHTDTEEG